MKQFEKTELVLQVVIAQIEARIKERRRSARLLQYPEAKHRALSYAQGLIKALEIVKGALEGVRK